MKKQWIMLVAILGLLAIAVASHIDRAKTYSEFSIKRHKMCLDQATVDQGAIDFCGHAASAADAAYSTAVSGEQTDLFMLVNCMLVLGVWIFSVEKRLVKLEKNADS